MTMLWDLQAEGAKQFFNSWTTGIKLTWNCPRATRTYLVQQVIACGSTSAKVEIMARYCKFFRSLHQSPSREVATLANLMARDIRSTTGGNLSLIAALSGKDPWTDSTGSMRAALEKAETVEVPHVDKWRVGYLGVLLEQRMEWQDDEEKEMQTLIDSICVN